MTTVFCSVLDVLSATDAQKLARAAGGLVLYVPVRSPFSHPLDVLPAEAQKRLAKIAGGCRVYVPKLDAIWRAARNQEIRGAYDAGEPVRSLALRYRLSERQIYAILGRTDDDDRGAVPDSQMTLWQEL